MNSPESEAKRMVSRSDHLEIMESALDLLERGADCIGCKIAANPKPWINTRTIAWGALVAALFLPPLIPLGEIIGVATADRGPIMGPHEIELLSPVVKIGQPLIVKTTSEYLRPCVWHWVLEWRTEEGQPIAMENHVGSAHAIGVKTSHEMAFAPPRGITPGRYVFHESATGECAHDDVGKIIDKDLHFTVTN